MKYRRNMTPLRSALAFSLVVGSFAPTTFIGAQEAAQIVFEPEVYLQVKDAEPALQSALSFEIYDVATGNLVYSNTSENKTEGPLRLAVGEYIFRLYDGGGFMREGEAVQPDKVAQTITGSESETVTTDDTLSDTLKVNANKGEVKTLTDGRVVYEVTFQVETGEALVDAATGELKSELDIYLTTQLEQVESEQESTERTEQSESEEGSEESDVSETSESTGDTSQPLSESSEFAEASESIAEESSEQTGSIVIEVVGETTKTPVVGAVIAIDAQEYTSDDNGRIVIDTMPVGTYTLSMIQLPAGFEGELNDAITVEANTETALTLNVGEAETTTTTETTTTQAAETTTSTTTQSTTAQAAVQNVTLTLVDQEQQPVANATIRLDQTEQVTNDQGHVVFENVTAGTYNYAIVNLPEHVSGDASGTLTIIEGQDMTVPLHVIRETPTYQGVLVFNDQHGAPIKDVQVTIQDQAYTSDDQGHITVSGLVSGDYAYTITALPNNITGNTSGTLTIKESNDAITTVQLTRAETPATSQIVVKDDQGHAVNNAEIYFGGLKARTNDQGVATFSNIQPGLYHFGISQLPNHYTDNSGEKTVTLSEGQNFSETITVTQKVTTAAVTLTVQDMKGNPMSGVEVTLNNQKVITNANGLATFSNINPGSYTYTVTKVPQGYTLDNQAHPIEVVAGQTAQQSIKLTPSAAPTTTQTTTTTAKEQVKVTKTTGKVDKQKGLLPSTGEAASLLAVGFAAVAAGVGVLLLRHKKTTDKK